MRVRSVIVNGAPKGEIYYKHGRWWYVRRLGGVTSFFSEDEVKNYVSRICNQPIDLVEFKNEKQP